MTDSELDRQSFAAFREAVDELMPAPNESALMRSTDERDVDTATMLHWLRCAWATHNSLAGDNPAAAHEFAVRVTADISAAVDEVPSV